MSSIYPIKKWKGVDILFDSWSHRFLLDANMAANLDKEDLVAIRKWCIQRQRVFCLLADYHHAGGHWASFFSSEEDLELVINSGAADEREKQDAVAELRCRRHGIKPAQNEKKSNNGPISGVVYLIEAKGQGLYKIGKTTRLSQRMKYFATKMPYEPILVCTIPSDDIDTLESDLHTRFSEKNKRGEWFKLDETDIKYIKGLGNNHD